MNFAATWCGAGLKASLTKPPQLTAYQTSTAPTQGASPRNKRHTTLPLIRRFQLAFLVDVAEVIL